MQEKITEQGSITKSGQIWTSQEKLSKETVTTVRNDGATSKIKTGGKAVCS